MSKSSKLRRKLRGKKFSRQFSDRGEATWLASHSQTGSFDASPIFRRTRRRRRPPTARRATFTACLRRAGGFHRNRKTIRGDELHSPSCQRLTRPALFLPLCSRRFSPRQTPRRALVKHCRTLAPVVPSAQGKLDLLLRNCSRSHLTTRLQNIRLCVGTHTHTHTHIL